MVDDLGVSVSMFGYKNEVNKFFENVDAPCIVIPQTTAV
jgi:hypothetical protein